MNDTEAEARRLLAAAAEDLPSGIDLLAGFAAARRRDRAGRTRRGAVLSAGIVIAAAAVTAVTLTVGSASPASATVTSALTRTLTQSYHLTEQESSYYIWGGPIKARSHITCTIESDPVRHISESSCSNGIGNREVGGYTYVHMPFAVTHYPGRRWERMPASLGISAAGTCISCITTATPQQVLADLEKADKVTAIGPASGPGWTGTRYAFSGPQSADSSLTGTVDVDQQGRARALILTMRETATVVRDRVYVTTQSLTFSDFGAPVIVTAPPADQTFPMS
jgi:hypothetical protein